MLWVEKSPNEAWVDVSKRLTDSVQYILKFKTSQDFQNGAKWL